MSIEYREFLARKQFADVASGFEPAGINPALFDFQQAMVRWACQRGRAALFADTGLGKTAMQVEWARQVHERTGRPVLILAPLCVAQQTVAEAARFGVTVTYTREQPREPGVYIANYEMLGRFDAAFFAGVVLDESSILKSHDSKTRLALIEAFSRTPYRLSCTATPSPNDHMELGNQAEFLGVMSQTEMLAMFFTHDGGETQSWRLKGHGKTRFWEWMATWAICVRNPVDLGFDGERYVLPGLQTHEHLVGADFVPEGQMFPSIAQTLTERRQAKRASLETRVELAAELVNASDEPWIVWCHLNDESAQLAKLIPGAVEVTGSLPQEEKERRIMAFTRGEARVIVTKPSIAGFGLNWQHCRNMAFVGLDDSYESYYQAVRRCHRFGQTRPVHVHLIASEAEGAVRANLERKQAQANEMAGSMVAHMRELTRQQIRGTQQEKSDYRPTVPMRLPEWIRRAA